MKRTLSFILAALLLASSAISCGKANESATDPAETDKVETSVTETLAPATDAAETEAPAEYAYDTSLITENGVAKAHIVLFDGASGKEKEAANELAYHLKLVSGADVTVTNTAQGDSLPIIIATPDSLPELEELFPEDLAWLRTLEERNGDDVKRFGDDGFAIRQKDGKIYIFGATDYGAMNGVYDFIEENLDLIWVTSTEDGIIYDEMPTVSVVKADYREKSPFTIRGRGGNLLLSARNKYVTFAGAVGGEHNITALVLASPIYDPNITEYWEKGPDGNTLSPESSQQVNYWSQLTADTVAASVIAQLDTYTDADRPPYITASMNDFGFKVGVYPEMTQPFEYAPGQFIDSTSTAYLSTVYFTFINRVAQKIAEKYPDATLLTLAYDWAIAPPVCEIDDNVAVWYCPFNEDYTQGSFADALTEAEEEGVNGDMALLEAIYYEEWVNAFPDTPILIYNYYFCHYVGGLYERPIWYRIQDDFQYYAEDGGIGTTACGVFYDNSSVIYDFQRGYRVDLTEEDMAEMPYIFTTGQAHAMNLMTMWIYYKLAWNPYEDVDALIEYFCSKVYGDAAEYMKEYYDLLTLGWNAGAEVIPEVFNGRITMMRDAQYYFDYFIDFDLDDGTYYLDAVKDTLTKAWEAADDKAKEFIRRPYECFMDWERFLQ